MLHCVTKQPEWLPKKTIWWYLQEDVFFKTKNNNSKFLFRDRRWHQRANTEIPTTSVHNRAHLCGPASEHFTELGHYFSVSEPAIEDNDLHQTCTWAGSWGRSPASARLLQAFPRWTRENVFSLSTRLSFTEGNVTSVLLLTWQVRHESCGLPIIHHSKYVCDLPTNHRFPMGKFPRVLHFLFKDQVITENQVGVIAKCNIYAWILIGKAFYWF